MPSFDIDTNKEPKSLIQKNITEICLFLTALPVIINWSIFWLNWILAGASRPGGYLDFKFSLSKIELPKFFITFWPQAVWTLLFLILSIIFTIRNKKRNFTLWINFGLIPLLYLLTWMGIAFLYSATPSNPILISYLIILLISLIFSFVKKIWSISILLLILWPIFINLLGSLWQT